MKIAAKHRGQGFTLVEIMIVIAIIGLLAAIAVPNMIKARNKSQATACMKNLQMIDGAKETWALEAKKGVADTVIDSEVNGYIKGGAPLCPGNGTYSYNALTEPPTCTLAGHVLPSNAAVAGTGGGTAPGGTAGGTTPSGDASDSGSSGSGSGSGNSGPGNGS